MARIEQARFIGTRFDSAGLRPNRLEIRAVWK